MLVGSNGPLMEAPDPSIPGNCAEFRPASKGTSPKTENQHVQYVCRRKQQKHKGALGNQELRKRKFEKTAQVSRRDDIIVQRQDIW